jgi:uncharacterized protein (DUF1800 family)
MSIAQIHVDEFIKGDGMKRSDFIASLVAAGRTAEPSGDDQGKTAFADDIQSAVAGPTSGLEIYDGPWGPVPGGYEAAAHLLRRTMFGAAKADIEHIMQRPFTQAIEEILAPQPGETSEPMMNVDGDPIPFGQPWGFSPDRGNTGARTASLKAWWLGLMLNQSLSVREKMVLFWHNHFVTSIGTVNEPRYSYRYAALLRRFALGNFKEFTKQVTIDGAMLRYLNGNTNRYNGSPDPGYSNENYGRELQELFTIGKGEEVVPGDYTNYTEEDVRAAARVLTGWRDDALKLGDRSNPAEPTSLFDPTRHNPNFKSFSYRYGSATVQGYPGAEGRYEIDLMMDIIFAQQEVSRNIVRDIYRWFVYYTIDATTETNVIEPLAQIFRTNNYEILPVLNALFKSKHFFDSANVGCMIKNPLDFLVTVFRQFAIPFPTSLDLDKQYYFWNSIASEGRNLQQDLGDPPSVAGWPAYYQFPQYYKLWINTDTFPRRNRFTDQIAGNGISYEGFTLVFDPIPFVKAVSQPSDVNVVLDEITRYLMPFPLTATQKAFLKETLIPGLPDYEWTIEWDMYLADETNVMKANAMRSKLKQLFRTIMQLPEYQLT